MRDREYWFKRAYWYRLNYQLTKGYEIMYRHGMKHLSITPEECYQQYCREEFPEWIKRWEERNK